MQNTIVGQRETGVEQPEANIPKLLATSNELLKTGCFDNFRSGLPAKFEQLYKQQDLQKEQDLSFRVHIIKERSVVAVGDVDSTRLLPGGSI